MATLEELKPTCAVRGVLPSDLVAVINVKWFGTAAIEITYIDITYTDAPG